MPSDQNLNILMKSEKVTWNKIEYPETIMILEWHMTTKILFVSLKFNFLDKSVYVLKASALETIKNIINFVKLHPYISKEISRNPNEITKYSNAYNVLSEFGEGFSYTFDATYVLPKEKENKLTLLSVQFNEDKIRKYLQLNILNKDICGLFTIDKEFIEKFKKFLYPINNALGVK